MRTIVLIAVLIGAGVVRSAAQTAQKPMDACALLTSSEVAAANGGTATPHESDLGGTGVGCMWGGAPGTSAMISVSLSPMPQGLAREAAFAKLTETYQQLKAQGWTEVRKDFANGTCSAMTPPASSKKDAPAMTGCLADVKGKLVNVVYMSLTGAPIEKVKPLLDKAIGRVP